MVEGDRPQLRSSPATASTSTSCVGIDLVRVGNDGIAFGPLSDGGALVTVVIVVAAAGAFVAATSPTSMPSAPGRRACGSRSACSLGGALGNLVDRVRDGVRSPTSSRPAALARLQPRRRLRSRSGCSCCSTSSSVARAMRLRTTPETAGERLDAFLAEPLGSRARAQRLIEAGAVLVDGRPVAKGHRLVAGELAEVARAAGRSLLIQTVPVQVEVVYQRRVAGWWSRSRPGLIVHPAPRPARADAGRRAGRTWLAWRARSRAAWASFIGSIATLRGCSSSPGVSEAAHRTLARADRRPATVAPRLHRPRRRAVRPARTGDDRRAARPRPAAAPARS